MALGSPRFDFLATSSTNDLARDWAMNEGSEGALFVAESQLSGRGRRGTQWNSITGESALTSVVVYPDIPLRDFWKLGIVTSVALVQACSTFGVDAQIKWPNDIIASGKKLAGILVETVALGDNRNAGIIGAGTNVLQDEFLDSEDYALTPTSIKIEVGESSPTVDSFIRKYVHCLSYCYDLLTAGDWDTVFVQYSHALAVGYQQAGMDIVTGIYSEGVLVDVRPADGAARLQTEHGFVFVLPSTVPGSQAA